MQPEQITVIVCNEDGEASLTIWETSAYLEALNRGEFGRSPAFLYGDSYPVHEDLNSRTGHIILSGRPLIPKAVASQVRYEL